MRNNQECVYLFQASLHSRQDHDDGHEGAEQQQEGESQACDGGAVSRRATSR